MAAAAVGVLTVGTVSFLSYRASQQELAETPITKDEGTVDVEKAEQNVPDDRTETEKPAPSAPAPEVAPAEYKAPLSGEIIAHYSPDQPIYSYTTKDWRVHNGVDLAAPLGQQVPAARAGTVMEKSKVRTSRVDRNFFMLFSSFS